MLTNLFTFSLLLRATAIHNRHTTRRSSPTYESPFCFSLCDLLVTIPLRYALFFADFAAHCRPFADFRQSLSPQKHPFPARFTLFHRKTPSFITNSPLAPQKSALSTRISNGDCRFAENKTRQIGNLNTVNKTPVKASHKAKRTPHQRPQ